MGQRKEMLSFRTVNTKHDTTSYESCSCKREIFDLNVLYESFQKAKKESDWKPQVQKFEINLLSELVKLQRELQNRTFEFSKPNEFILRERGKTRLISGDPIRDRVVKRALCDDILIPAVRSYLVYDNGASLKGKGIDFTRCRLETHLMRFYQTCGTNDGYIRLTDFTKFFDNIRHKELLAMFRELTSNDPALWLLEKVLEQARIDVSYMSDKEYENSLNAVFNSLEHEGINKELLTGHKYLEKRMNIGDQVAQVAGIFYPHKLDNFIKIVKGMEFYGRYMDDSYIIHKDKNYLVELGKEVDQKAREYGIFINERKTRICKLSDSWRFLQIQYSVTKTGRIIKKINPKRLTTMRRKLKKLPPIMNRVEFENYYKSWFKNHYKIMSEKQRENMDRLYHDLRRAYYD